MYPAILSSYLFRPRLPILKPRGSPTQQQALNVHFNTTRFQKDVQLLWFAQNYCECGSFAQICPHVFPGSLPHKDIGIGKVMRVPGCSKLANFTGSWRNFLYKFQKGLNGVHSDKSAANNCNLRQWRSQQTLMFGLHWKHAVLFASFAHSSRFQTHPVLCGLCIGLWYGFGTLNVNDRFALETAHVASIDMLTSKIISFGWSSLGTSLGSSYLFRPCLPI